MASTPFPTVPPPTTTSNGDGPDSRDRSRSTFFVATLFGGLHHDRNHMGRRSIAHLPVRAGKPVSSVSTSSRWRMLCSKSTKTGHPATIGKPRTVPKTHVAELHRKDWPISTTLELQRGQISNGATLARSTSGKSSPINNLQ